MDMSGPFSSNAFVSYTTDPAADGIPGARRRPSL